MSLPAGWWDSFFPQLFTGIQGRCIDPERTRHEARLLEQLLPLAPGSRVLDVPCGDGRIALELARRGHRVTGVDAARSLVEAAATRARDEGLDASFTVGDMRDLHGYEDLDAAVCVWTSFGYFDEAGDRAVARGVAAALRAGGHFAIEGHLVETFLPVFDRRGWSKVGEDTLIEDRRYDHETSRLEVDWTLFREDGEATRSSSSIRLYSFRELARLLEAEGFEDVRAYDAVSGEAFTLGARRALVIATRAS